MSKYGLAILEKWIADGSQPVAPVDQMMQERKAEKLGNPAKSK